jgi:hypothetical protein
MRTLTLKRVSTMLAGTVIGAIAGAFPASALSLGLGGSSLVHIEDCRSVSLARQAAYGFDYSSNTTGPQHVGVALAADGSLTLCYSLDVASASSVSISTHSDLSLNGVVSGLLNQTDASKVCASINLKAAPGVKGTVTAVASAHVLVDGLPPADWSNAFARNTEINSIGEDITFKTCADTAGNVSAA